MGLTRYVLRHDFKVPCIFEIFLIPLPYLGIIEPDRANLTLETRSSYKLGHIKSRNDRRSGLANGWSLELNLRFF